LKIAGLTILAIVLCGALGFAIYKFAEPIIFNHQQQYGDLELASG